MERKGRSDGLAAGSTAEGRKEPMLTVHRDTVPLAHSSDNAGNTGNASTMDTREGTEGPRLLRCYYSIG